MVEGQEEGLVSGELRGHPRLVQVNTEERQDALVELEADFTRVAVGLPLLLGVSTFWPVNWFFSSKANTGIPLIASSISTELLFTAL